MATKLVPVLDITIALTPPMLRAVGMFKLVPVMVTRVPGAPLEGLKEVMVGWPTVNTQAAPRVLLSRGPPTMAVLPSALKATE